jgi:1-acyl-sn-glycerol-3-phosphate acyltransferase
MYEVLRFFVRLALKIYCSHILVHDEKAFRLKGPLIISSNHPNAFFDAIILASYMKHPVYILATGELTDKFLVRRLMETLRIIPVYRLLDKPDNQQRNEKSFSLCADVLLNKGIILIFSEGTSENTWQLRRIKKLTARFVLTSLHHAHLQSTLQILPVGLNYNSYSRPGKTIIIQAGTIISDLGSHPEITESEKINTFNELLKERLSACVLQTENKQDMAQMLISNCRDIHSGQIKNLQDKLNETGNQPLISKLKKPGFLISPHHPLLQTIILVLLFAFPALLGWVLHIIIYYPVKLFVKKKTYQTVFFDSVLFASLFLIYPFYWTGLNIAGYFFFKNVWIQIFLLFMPLLAWMTICWNENLQRIRNYFILSGMKPELPAN